MYFHCLKNELFHVVSNLQASSGGMLSENRGWKINQRARECRSTRIFYGFHKYPRLDSLIILRFHIVLERFRLFFLVAVIFWLLLISVHPFLAKPNLDILYCYFMLLNSNLHWFQFQLQQPHSHRRSLNQWCFQVFSLLSIFLFDLNTNLMQKFIFSLIKSAQVLTYIQGVPSVRGGQISVGTPWIGDFFIPTSFGEFSTRC